MEGTCSSGCASSQVPVSATPPASEQAGRCLACGCSAHSDCRLERYAALYGANPQRFPATRRPYEILGREAGLIFEPGKCIKCELCVQIAEAAREPLGLTLVGRGFNVRLTVPQGKTFADGLSRVAKECVQACPTGALRFP